MLIARILSLIIGYLFGLFQTGYIYGRSKGIDIRKEGSGNAGTTNSLRVLGWKAGLITFLGDLFKAILAVLLIRLIFGGRYEDNVKVLELYAGFGAVLGHNFPCYLGFKGGKGIACTSGMILAVFPQAAPICLVLFIVAVAATRYVSLGSILVVSAYLIQVIVLGQMGWLKLTGAVQIEFYIVSACFTALALWQHRENIKRLLNGTENKFGMKKTK
ncbi:MAG: glycerol-3-phosphate 1-O-acyltransferase PlsY [Lachnospiraceae bacterium]|nr:glycerol-3-phosphate 1-O-acyltransferase PlsY [Lachnospiraceae bacterium]MDD7333241.1 glycerol-3-phosphate 1-O-acyltransferase PlsY [Lachnospiraceae bacterium]MDY3274586.1 glycerol-3-phosphate 1-O-acyltransferase PlsY [Agathobacter sp.]MDY5102787.1 glycerol-3-phosphate 1-O-acyltransferase PlsY [Agathobacter sp.]MDY5521939.1 glycerol-3-phosphate 1-O-acyltransferase PlsY [Agathobacter sp.]